MIQLVLLTAAFLSAAQDPEPWPVEQNRLGGGWVLRNAVYADDNRRDLGRYLSRAASPKLEPWILAGAPDAYGQSQVYANLIQMSWVNEPGGQGHVQSIDVLNDSTVFDRHGSTESHMGSSIGVLFLDRYKPERQFVLSKGKDAFLQLIGADLSFFLLPPPPFYGYAISRLRVYDENGDQVWSKSYPWIDEVSDSYAALNLPPEWQFTAEADPNLCTRWTGRAIVARNVGDIDGDRWDDLAVGRPGNSSGPPSTRPGRVHFYSGHDGAGLGTAQRDEEPLFGLNVFPLGDMNGDDVLDVAVSEINLEYKQTWLFGSPSNVQIVTTDDFSTKVIVESPAESSGGFGAFVLGRHSLDGEPGLEMVVSSPLEQVGGEAVGAIRALENSTFDELWITYGDAPGQLFGVQMAWFSDLDGDDVPEILANQSQLGIGGAGAVWVLSGASGARLMKLTSDDYWAEFGTSIVPLANYEVDARPNAVFGAPGTMVPGTYARGAAYELEFDPYVATNLTSLSASSGADVEVRIDFPPLEDANKYYVLLSAAGTEPTQLAEELWVPLSDDALLQSFLDNSPPAWADEVISARVGSLDADGKATVSLSSHPALSDYLDSGLYLAVLAIGPAPDNEPRLSSVAREIEIRP